MWWDKGEQANTLAALLDGHICSTNMYMSEAANARDIYARQVECNLCWPKLQVESFPFAWFARQDKFQVETHGAGLFNMGKRLARSCSITLQLVACLLLAKHKHVVWA